VLVSYILGIPNLSLESHHAELISPEESVIPSVMLFLPSAPEKHLLH